MELEHLLEEEKKMKNKILITICIVQAIAIAILANNKIIEYQYEDTKRKIHNLQYYTMEIFDSNTAELSLWTIFATTTNFVSSPLKCSYCGEYGTQVHGILKPAMPKWIEHEERWIGHEEK